MGMTVRMGKERLGRQQWGSRGTDNGNQGFSLREENELQRSNFRKNTKRNKKDTKMKA